MVFTFIRHLPHFLYVPPWLAVQRGIFDSWVEVVDACESADDQVLVMPRNRALDSGTEDLSVECRPRDPADSVRHRTLDSVFQGMRRRPFISIPAGEWDLICELAERLGEKCERR
jgi:hypothetical protein